MFIFFKCSHNDHFIFPPYNYQWSSFLSILNSKYLTWLSRSFDNLALPNLFCTDMSSMPIMLVSFLRRMYENTRFLLFLLLTYSQGKQISCFGFSFHSASLNSTYVLSYGTISNSFMKTSPIYCSN